MKAVIIEKPGQLAFRDLPVPSCGPYEMLCELLYGATCSGTDLHLIDGTFPWPVHYPIILGHESIGRVVETGAKVRNFKVGDLVTRVGTPAPEGSGLGVFGGGFAEYGIAGDSEAMKADGLVAEQWGGFLVNQRLPQGTDPAGATMVITWRETFSHLSRMGFARGNSLLIIGSGANAFSFAAHARNLGASFVAMVGSPARNQTAKAIGVDSYFDYHKADVQRAVSAAHGAGFDFAIDAVGKAGQIDMAVALLKPGGAAAVYGLDNFASLKLDLSRIFKPFRYSFSNYEESEAHERVVAFVQAGQLKAEHFMDLANPFPLEQIQDAYDYSRSRKALKALVKIA